MLQMRCTDARKGTCRGRAGDVTSAIDAAHGCASSGGVCRCCRCGR